MTKNYNSNKEKINSLTAIDNYQDLKYFVELNLHRAQKKSLSRLFVKSIIQCMEFEEYTFKFEDFLRLFEDADINKVAILKMTPIIFAKAHYVRDYSLVNNVLTNFFESDETLLCNYLLIAEKTIFASENWLQVINSLSSIKSKLAEEKVIKFLKDKDYERFQGNMAFDDWVFDFLHDLLDLSHKKFTRKTTFLVLDAIAFRLVNCEQNYNPNDYSQIKGGREYIEKEFLTLAIQELEIRLSEGLENSMPRYYVERFRSIDVSKFISNSLLNNFKNKIDEALRASDIAFIIEITDNFLPLAEYNSIRQGIAEIIDFKKRYGFINTEHEFFYINICKNIFNEIEKSDLKLDYQDLCSLKQESDWINEIKKIEDALFNTSYKRKFADFENNFRSLNVKTLSDAKEIVSMLTDNSLSAEDLSHFYDNFFSPDEYNIFSNFFDTEYCFEPRISDIDYDYCDDTEKLTSYGKWLRDFECLHDEDFAY
jgi:hypothetical protein